ncbi:AAA family ATPase [Dactylococcopsis salina]|uniref:ATPase n=1 Tax=Dactylococcopsis salina (strain PCC 8305) TaxID=13035 RepID=K9YUD6_DACS8|nr:ATP-binding protein [Dactylococcopsis salina]AFZ50122.1 putative ATPase [Dactylococcopsis salina PCC 8305]
MYFTELDIYHFRDIESLEIREIKQVNLITGRNNCGKTSILEAIFLLSGMSNPQLSLRIHNFRNFNLTEADDFSYLFKDLNFSHTPQIRGKLTSQNRQLQIEPIHQTTQTNQQQFSEKSNLNENDLFSYTSPSNEYNSEIEGIQFNYSIDNQNSYQSLIRLKQGQGEISIPHNYRENLTATFLSPNTIMSSLGQQLEKAIIRKKLKSIITALQEIEPRLLDIRMGNRGIVYADLGLDNLVPINVMGDGFIRILAILASISENKNGILIIDEIENGFHYKTLAVLWKAMLKMAFQSNVQLFLVTHSYECIESLVNVYQTMKPELREDFVSLFRIERNAKGEHKAFQYEGDTLMVGIQEEIEVR